MRIGGRKGGGKKARKGEKGVLEKEKERFPRRGGEGASCFTCDYVKRSWLLAKNAGKICIHTYVVEMRTGAFFFFKRLHCMYGDLNCDYVKEGSLEREDLVGGGWGRKILFLKKKKITRKTKV